ncbi:MAG: hypothetical protein Q8L48_40870 [Archangium sp.]|nr:hypothetical protein [Archangium sp.]
MLKWKLMMTTLPFVLVVTGLKALVEFGFHFTGVVDFADVGVVLTGAVFLTGFLLAGTMADYKESEKIPGDIANSLETMEEFFILAAAQQSSLDRKDLQRQVLTLTDAIRGWLIKRLTTPQVFAAFVELNATIVRVEKAGAGYHASRAVSQALSLRRAVSRIDVISRTGFLPPAYALLEVLLAVILGLMMVAKFKNPVATYVLVPFFALVNIYMLRLIKDIDDPFDYAPDGSKKGAAEVEIFPIHEYRDRLAARIGP